MKNKVIVFPVSQDFTAPQRAWSMVQSVNEASTARLAQTDSLHVQKGHLTITLVKCTTQAVKGVHQENTVIQQHRVFLQVHYTDHLFLFNDS